MSKNLKDFGDVRSVFSIVHALGKMRDTSKDVMKILDTVVSDRNWLVANGEPQSIANIAWAFARINGLAPVLFQEIEKKASYFVEHANPQNISEFCMGVCEA